MNIKTRDPYSFEDCERLIDYEIVSSNRKRKKKNRRIKHTCCVVKKDIRMI